MTEPFKKPKYLWKFHVLIEFALCKYILWYGCFKDEDIIRNGPKSETKWLHAFTGFDTVRVVATHFDQTKERGLKQRHALRATYISIDVS